MKNKTKTITIWECQDCGKLYDLHRTCWCCVDLEGNYFGKHDHYEMKCLGTYSASQIKSLKPIVKPKNDNRAVDINEAAKSWAST